MAGSTKRIKAAIESEPWLITEGALEQIRIIAARENEADAMAKYADANHSAELVSMAGESVAVMNVRGPMMRYASLFTQISGMTSTETVAAAFNDLDANKDVQRIIVQIDSPGGTVNGIGELGELIASAVTPVDAFITGLGCSAGYWIASQCDNVYCSSTSIVGSIGVRSRTSDEKDESEIHSKHAPAKLGGRQADQALIDRLEVEFHEVVAAGRGVSVEHVQKHFGQGGVFVGSDAVSAGLCDAVATLDQVIAGTVGISAPRRTKRQKETSMPEAVKKNDSPAVETTTDNAVDTNKIAAEAVAAERQRMTDIQAAGEGKPQGVVMAMITAGINAEQATTILAAIEEPEPKADDGKLPESVAQLISDARVSTDPRIAPESSRTVDEGDSVVAQALSIVKAEEEATR